MVVLVLMVDVTVVLEHGGSVVVGCGMVVTPGGNVVGANVVNVVVGHSPPGQSTWMVVDVVTAVVPGCAGPQANRRRKGARVWRTMTLSGNAACTPWSAAQTRAWKAPGTWAGAGDAVWSRTTTTAASTKARRRKALLRRCSAVGTDPSAPLVRMPPPFRLAVGVMLQAHEPQPVSASGLPSGATTRTLKA